MSEGWHYNYGNVVHKFAAVHGIVKMLVGIAKCTGRIGGTFECKWFANVCQTISSMQLMYKTCIPHEEGTGVFHR